VPVAGVRGRLWHRQDELSAAALEPFDLTLFEDEIERLIATPDSEVMRVLHRPFAVADYHLSAKCDGCPYNAVCFIDSAERQDLSLIPLLTATEKTRLAARRAAQVQQLATLMDYEQRDMVPAPGRESDIAGLSKAGRSRQITIAGAARQAALQNYDVRLKKTLPSPPRLRL